MAQETKTSEVEAVRRPLNIERVKELADEHREGLSLLAKHDGPVERPEDSKSE